MTRSEMYRRLRVHAGAWDMIVVGGGATGCGVAIDAASYLWSAFMLGRIRAPDDPHARTGRGTTLAVAVVKFVVSAGVNVTDSV